LELVEEEDCENLWKRKKGGISGRGEKPNVRAQKTKPEEPFTSGAQRRENALRKRR